MNEYNNDDKVKKMLQSENVPEELKPENIKIMLDEKAPTKKRINISHKTARITAVAAACAITCGFAVNYMEQRNNINYDVSDMLAVNNNDEDGTKENVQENTKGSDLEFATSNALADDEIYETSTSDDVQEITEKTSETNNQPEEAVKAASLMRGASDYGEIYNVFEKASEKYKKRLSNVPKTANADTDSLQTNEVAAESELLGTGGGDDSYTDTFNQEDGVLEADIAKTDGKYIYFLNNKYIEYNNSHKPLINIAETDSGNFTASNVLDISLNIPVTSEVDYKTSIEVKDMYLYNDMLIIISATSDYYCGNDYSNMEACYDTMWGAQNCHTYVSVYTTGLEPQLIDNYMQDGMYNDVRITSDGYMYLISNDFSKDYNNVAGIDDTSSYIPSCGFGGKAELIAPENILIPDTEIEGFYSMPYTIIGSLDFNNPNTFAEKDVKAIAGFSGSIYCSGDNLYTAIGYQDTEITRIALSNGTITPMAAGTVKGYIYNQFSMSEYNGYFRIATTADIWEDDISDGILFRNRTSINNYVYVLDMDMNVVGSVGDFGINETIKSVSFNGNLAYVVTYEQTDPLFSIDVSNPQQPVILDEYKITGYSTYMQQWSDGLLLGFGVNADENGVGNGVKIVMFNNSNPNELAENGIYVMSSENADSYVDSNAIWERKALLISPDRNLIGVPTNNHHWSVNGSSSVTEYRFFSYENGEFILRGEISEECDGYYSIINFERAVCIGDYVYALSSNKFVSTDTATFTSSASVDF